METLQVLAALLAFGLTGIALWRYIDDLKTRLAYEQAERINLEQRLKARERDFRETIDALDAVTRKKVRDYKQRSEPMATPPPGIQPALQKLAAQAGDLARDPYLFPVGWEITRGNPGVVALSLDNASEYRSGHIAITGESGYGKGHLAFLICAALTMRTTTAQMQIFAIDPKRDFALWKGKAHLWREPVLGRDPTAIKAAMAAIRAEREARERLREEHRVLEFEELPETARPPVLLIYISELDVLQLGADDLDGWLAAELSTSRASGIRFLIDAQNNSSRETRWRTHIGTFIAGFQSSQDWVRPNIGLSVNEIRERGAIPQNDLPGRGYFTVRNGRDVITVRAPHMPTSLRYEVLNKLPDNPQPVSVVASNPVPTTTATIPTATIPTPARPDNRRRISVTPDERTAILAAAKRFRLRRDVCAAVFEGATGGPAYQKVKMVLDEEGLLLDPTQTLEAA